MEGLHENDKALASGRIRRLQLDDMADAGRGRGAVRQLNAVQRAGRDGPEAPGPETLPHLHHQSGLAHEHDIDRNPHEESVDAVIRQENQAAFRGQRTLTLQTYEARDHRLGDLSPLREYFPRTHIHYRDKAH